MSSVPYFLVFFFACVGYAFVRGGQPERVAGVALLAALVASASVGLIQIAGGFETVPLQLLVVDVLLALVLTILSLRANRMWLIFASSCQWLAVAVHAAKLIHPAIISTSYAFLTVIWSWPITALVACGAIAHHRRQRAPIPEWRNSSR